MDLGTTLRTARERRGLSVEQLAAATKIPANLLRALEENEFHKVPRGIFVRGFLRSYAQEVRLDPKAIVEQFIAESGEAAPVVTAPAPAAAAVEEHIEEPGIDPNLSESRPGWGYVLIVAALVIAIVSFNRSSLGDRPDVTEPAGAAAPAADAVTTAAAAPPVAAARDVEPVATTGSGLHVDIEAQGPCWVEAVVDGKRVVYRLMQPGERQTLTAEDDLVLHVGDPGAFAYSLNGQRGQPLGKPGVPTRVRFTSGGGRVPLTS